MLENFIYAKQKSLFEEALNNGEVLDEAIVFIEDTKEIWNHGTYFDGSKVDLSNIEEVISKIKTDGDGLTYLTDKGEYKIPQIIVDSEEELNSITPEIGTRAVVRTIVEGYDNLNLAKIINGEETNIPTDMFDSSDKYVFKITSVDTSIQFPYQEDDEYAVYKLFTLQNSSSGGFEEFGIVTNQDGSSIMRAYINNINNTPITIYSGGDQSFYWNASAILEYIITINNIINLTDKDQNVINAFLLFSTALNVSIIANNEYIDYYYTSKGWIQNDYLNAQQFWLFFQALTNNFSEQIPIKTSQLENDSNFVSSDGLKTINGENIVGSGNIVISSGSSSGSGAYAEVNHGTSDTTFTLTPNTFHVWDEVVTLDLSFGEETSGVANEYLFQFTSGATATTLTLPSDIKWANDTAPTIAENMIYQISVLKGLASVLEFSNAPRFIENEITLSFGSSTYIVESQYPVASDVEVGLRTPDGLVKATIPEGETTANARPSGPFVDSSSYIESITPLYDSTYHYNY